MKFAKSYNRGDFIKTAQPVPVPFETSITSTVQPHPSEIQEQIREVNDLITVNPDEVFFVRMKEDSMINAGIYPEDLLFVDLRCRPKSGHIAAVIVNGELTVRRLFKNKSRLFLVPENNNYPALEISEKMDIYIWGTVTTVIRSLL